MNRTIRKGIRLAALCGTAGLLTGCAAAGEVTESAHQPRIFGATYMTRNNPYFDVLQETLENEVEANGDILISRDPCQMQDKQNDQIMEMLDEGIEVLFLNPVDWETVEPALQECQKRGVVVIDIDTVVKNKEYVVSIIETDNYEAGVQCAEDMMSRLDEARIVVLDNPIQTSISDRVQGFLDTIEGHEEYHVVARNNGEGEFEVGAEAMAEILERGVDCDVVLGGNDPSALGALAALQQYHMDEEILLYGIDGSPDFKSMISLGYATGTSCQNPKEIGVVAVQTAYSYLAGEEVEEYISIEPRMITAENLSEYEINSWGW